jgi:large subunit ribosomal protein L22
MAETTVRDTPVRESLARLRHVSISPSKVRMVLDLIRGQDVETARDTLHFCERSAAGEVGKLLDSAIANAEHNEQIPEDELFVVRAFADDGPTQKRWRPRARGRGVRIRKRSSHITIVVARFAEEDLERRRRADVASGRDQRRVVRRRRRTAETDAASEDILDDDVVPESTPVVGEDGDETEPDDQAESGRSKPAKKTTAKKATAKKATGAKQPATKATKTAKKSPAKKSPAKKATTEGRVVAVPIEMDEASAEEPKPRKAPAKRPPKTEKDED